MRKRDLNVVLDTMSALQTIVAVYQYEDADKAKAFDILAQLLEDTALAKAQADLEIEFPAEPIHGLLISPRARA